MIKFGQLSTAFALVSSFRPPATGFFFRDFASKSFVGTGRFSMGSDTQEETKLASGAPEWIELHSDKSKAELVRTSEVEWKATSQAGGVYRKMIERQGTEKVARATTIVKFSPNQSFPRHVHDGGEEFLVLDGVWKDDYGDFPKYSYIRNYIGSGHTPSIGEEGCVILVKLRQMSLLSKGEPEHKNWGELTPDQVSNKGRAEEDGTKQVSLFSSPFESTSVLLLPKGSSLKVKVPKHGAEIFVVDGTFTSELGTHNQWSWCRVPNEEDEAKFFEINTLDDDVYVWMKEGHLASDEIGV